MDIQDKVSTTTFFLPSSYLKLIFKVLNSVIHLTWRLEVGSLLLKI